MFPIGDDNTARRTTPVLTYVLIVANLAAFFFELHLAGQSDRLLAGFIQGWGVIPREYATGTDLPPRIDLPLGTTLFTSMFLHGGWGHLLGNMLYLWIFGDNVEDRLGRVPFLLVYLGTGVVGAVSQIIVNPGSTIPTIGASGAISGILGAYIVMFPTNRVRVLFFYLLLEVPALVVIGMWALTQFASGVGSLARTTETGGVAYMAHVGGFVAGAAVALVWRAIAGGPPRGRRPVRRPPPHGW